MATTIWSATQSIVTIDGEAIEGLQSIEYKVSRSRTDIGGVGSQLRSGVEYGTKVITGTLKVKSSCPKLDDKLAQQNVADCKFSMQAQLKKDDSQTPQRTIDFQDCYLDDRTFDMEINGVGVAVYTFSATDIKES